MDDVFNRVFRRVTIAGTSLGQANEIIANVEGVEGETDDGLLYGTLGILANPRPQDADGAATGIAVVGADGLEPIATFDRRLAAARGALPTGALSLPGYQGQHVTTLEGAVAGQPKIIIEISGARVTLEGSVAGPTIKVERDGTPGVSVTIGPTNTVDVVRAGVAENVALYAPLQPLLQELVDTLQLLIAGDPFASPTPVPGLGTIIAALPGGSLLAAALATQLVTLLAASVAALNVSVASSAVLKASPT